jgi:hypothetical protein
MYSMSEARAGVPRTIGKCLSSKWHVLDSFSFLQVLRFYGYFKESVVESNIENHRVRKVVLYYYLEDDSLHVAEPRQDNSGIPQVRNRLTG